MEVTFFVIISTYTSAPYSVPSMYSWIIMSSWQPLKNRTASSVSARLMPMLALPLAGFTKTGSFTSPA